LVSRWVVVSVCVDSWFSSGAVWLCVSLILSDRWSNASFVMFCVERIAFVALSVALSSSAGANPVTGVASLIKGSQIAKNAIRPLTAVYIANKVQNIRNDTLMKAAGLTAEEAEPIARAKSERGIEAATEMVTDEIMDKVVIAGNPGEVTVKLNALAQEGLTLPLLYQCIGPDREQAIRLVADRVRPAFLAGS